VCKNGKHKHYHKVVVQSCTLLSTTFSFCFMGISIAVFVDHTHNTIHISSWITMNQCSHKALLRAMVGVIPASSGRCRHQGVCGCVGPTLPPRFQSRHTSPRWSWRWPRSGSQLGRTADQRCSGPHTSFLQCTSSMTFNTHSRLLAKSCWVYVELSPACHWGPRPCIFTTADRQGKVRVCVGRLMSLVPCIDSAWLSCIVSLTVLFRTEQSGPSSQHAV